MKRTGNYYSSLVLFLVFCLLGFVPAKSVAQSGVNVVATVSETTIYTGERISLSVEISGSFNNVSRPELPEFEGFRLLSNNPSTSRSYSYVNGQTSSSYSYSYYLIAQEEGTYTIPPITVSIDGEELTTEAIDVEIVDRNSSASDPISSSRPEIFLRLEGQPAGAALPVAQPKGIRSRLAQQPSILVAVGVGPCPPELGDVLAVGPEKRHVHAIERGSAHQPDGGASLCHAETPCRAPIPVIRARQLGSAPDVSQARSPHA